MSIASSKLKQYGWPFMLVAVLVVALSFGLGSLLANFVEARRAVESGVFMTNSADVNLDAAVDLNDIFIVADNLGLSTLPAAPRDAFAFGDANLDSRIDVLDLVKAGRNYDARGQQ